MDGLRRDLESVLRAVGADAAPAGLAALSEAWPSVVGAVAARSAWPARLTADGTLHVTTVSAIWTQELTLLQVEILERLRAAVPDAAPERLRFAPGHVPPAPPTAQEPAAAPVPTPEEEATAVELASVIDDPVLRDAIRVAARWSLAARRRDDPV